MMRDVRFTDVIEKLRVASSNDEARGLLNHVVSEYGLKNAVYYADRMPELTQREPYLALTYQEDWVRHYKEQDFFSIDPVLRAGAQSLLPVDWDILDRSAPKVRQMFDEARDFAIGHKGLTFPIRGVNGETALLSITSDFTDREWAKTKSIYMRDFQVIANFIHEMIVRTQKTKKIIPKLSPREHECLKWASEGKTYEDIALLIGIRPGTVKTYMEMSRRKLNALNTTHMVARALSLKLIDPPG
ncbi:LuxR family transcriptional regulator [Stappia sp. ES.058]|uniref:LuxR family transcriptional regulator n=1 Tax=Stappia sp. ES.058 TaxID=1881061 RepID=UPI00087B4B74|nr:LuxR family transcriptional regulator [Stappia sp. ES.058]SDT95255.1 DNA-binding transcriptional regulator, CsgD family [Stappia sp. ES.058]